MAGARMKAVRVVKRGALDLVETEIPEPAAGQVRVKVAACGVCHSDAMVKEGLWPDLQLPRTPGHEVAGTIEALGPGVTPWKVGQRVGIGWAGARDGTCEPCRRGDFINCQNHRITGIHYDGGYAEFMIAPVEALAAIPDELSFEEAAPLLCAGITTYNPLRHSSARPGDLVAIQGIGGLGHLAIQFASKMGFRTVALSSGRDKEALARKLGAHVYVDGATADATQELKKLGGARVILATAPSSKAISPLVGGLAARGELIIVGAAADPLSIAPTQLIMTALTVRGWPSGTAIDSEDTLRFCALTGIRPMIEKFPLGRAAEAFDRMMSNKVRFRAVLSGT